MTMTTATDKLSRAASAVWRLRTAEPDPMGDPSGDCGDLIAADERRWLLRAVADAGYATPAEYNAELGARLSPGWAGQLEIEDVCGECGAALTVTHPYTREYGGGSNTVYHCPACGLVDVCA